MSMLEKMARRLAQDALERVKPGTYTSVVDGVSLYQMLDGNYQVGERLGAGDEDEPGISYETARETMVALMAEQAGAGRRCDEITDQDLSNADSLYSEWAAAIERNPAALRELTDKFFVLERQYNAVPEDAPMDSRLLQIADMLVNSADVPTDAQDVADGAAIVGTVKNALDYLDAARHDNGLKRATILELSGHLNAINTMLAKSPDMPLSKDDLQVWPQTVAGVADALRYLDEARSNCVAKGNEIARWHAGANELQDKYLAAQQEIGALTAKLEEARRSIRRGADEAANCQARYEAMTEALSLAMDKLAGVGK